jgi:vitamin B12/bleomycin/antimicrobial peptide transport system ATP-binding/permease protein
MMSDPPGNAPDSASATDATANSGLVPELAMMYQALWTSPVRNTLFMQAGAIFIVVAATAYGQILLNNWNKPFYDALSRRDFTEFLIQLGVFGLIAGALLVLNVVQRYLGEMSKVKLREGLVEDLIHHWMLPGCASRLAHAGPIGINPDQRMHEDARHLTELSSDLAIGLLQASILLLTFISVLWNISRQFAFHIGGRDVVIPGYMVWAAIIYSASASLLSYWVGKSLVNRNAEHYAREADLRYSLVRINDHIDAIALAGGEADEARHIDLDLAGVLTAMRRLVLGLTNLTWVTAGSGWVTIVAPIIAAAPLYFAGKITFGGLMLASGAFMQVQSSLRWFVDNFSTIADWRATLLRVASFRRAMIDGDAPREAERRISMIDGDAGEIRLDELAIATRSGSTRLEEQSVRIKPGERILIVGESGTRKTLVFRALAGLWTLGAGRIARPKGEPIMYIPRTAYLPPGTLREVLTYPSTVEPLSTQAFADALSRLGLARLVPQLDSARHWDQVLTEDEQQGLVFARVLLRKPPWLLMDEVLDTLDKPTLERICDVFGKELAHTGFIYIGRETAQQKLFTRVLHLINDKNDGDSPPA